MLGMIQPGQRPGFPREPLGEGRFLGSFGRNDFERDEPVEVLLPGLSRTAPMPPWPSSSMISSCGKCGARSAMAAGPLFVGPGGVIAEPGRGKERWPGPSAIRQAGQSPSGASAASGRLATGDRWRSGSWKTFSWNETVRHILLRKTRLPVTRRILISPQGGKQNVQLAFDILFHLPRFAQ
jgi:hypothetical protein